MDTVFPTIAVPAKEDLSTRLLLQLQFLLLVELVCACVNIPANACTDVAARVCNHKVQELVPQQLNIV